MRRGRRRVWQRSRRSAVTGYALAWGECFACGRFFGFNPHAVPSHEGEPVCGSCMVVVNERRAAQGLPPFTVRPDAYEPIPATEL
jgi:hypothetical protein